MIMENVLYMGLIYLDDNDQYKGEIKKYKITKINKNKTNVYTEKSLLISNKSTKLFTTTELNREFYIFKHIIVYYSLNELSVENWIYERMKRIKDDIISQYRNLKNITIVKKY